MSFNEGKACDAVIRYLEAKTGLERSDLRFPEREGHADPVEMTCSLGGQLYAFEHTGIEPFDGQIQLGVQSAALFSPIIERLSKLLPPEELLELHVPVGATAGLKRRDFKIIQDRIVAWIDNVWSALPTSPLGRLVSPQRGVMLDGVPFPVSLYRVARLTPPGTPLVITHLVSEDVDDVARIRRIEKAYTSKIGKLAAWKRDAGARSVLILEDDDIQLTNPVVVARALLEVVGRFPERPDAVYQVTSCVEPWWVSPLLVDHTSIFEVGDYEWAWEVDPAVLTSLTGR